MAGNCVFLCISSLSFVLTHDEPGLEPTSEVTQKEPCNSAPHPEAPVLTDLKEPTLSTLSSLLLLPSPSLALCAKSKVIFSKVNVVMCHCLVF